MGTYEYSATNLTTNSASTLYIPNTWNDPYIYTSMGPMTVGTVYQPAPNTLRLNGAPVVEAAALPEDDLAWLRRRVEEICWIPA